MQNGAIVEIQYREEPGGFVACLTNVHGLRFLGAMAPDVETLRGMLQRRLPGKSLSLVLEQ